MVRLIYKEFCIHDDYLVGVRVGPPFKASFTGMRYVSNNVPPPLPVAHAVIQRR